ncbi:MAG TPA: 30S ribosomal protein S3 [Candidatus Nanoarchaeia archaeon]|nr:30S ribosomal protein S3 [Candidatus Nanoarchaeia archaeon]
MIERQFVVQKMKEFQIQEFISSSLKNSGHSHTRVQRTPLGEKIIIFASRPGLIVGRKGQNIKKLTLQLKRKFDLENPQIEISEVESIFLDAQIVAEMIANSLERFGSQRFKGIGHKLMMDAMNAGALGIEILISGKLPSARAKSWRFYQGYLKKCGDIAIEGVRHATAAAQLKSGTIGIQVRIMPPTVSLPDDIELRNEGEVTVKAAEMAAAEEKTQKKKRVRKKKETGTQPEVANEAQ